MVNNTYCYIWIITPFSFLPFPLIVLTNKPVNPKQTTDWGENSLIITTNVSVDFHHALCNFEFLNNECSIFSALKPYLVLFLIVLYKLN